MAGHDNRRPTGAVTPERRDRRIASLIFLGCSLAVTLFGWWSTRSIRETLIGGLALFGASVAVLMHAELAPRMGQKASGWVSVGVFVMLLLIGFGILVATSA